MMYGLRPKRIGGVRKKEALWEERFTQWNPSAMFCLGWEMSPAPMSFNKAPIPATNQSGRGEEKGLSFTSGQQDRKELTNMAWMGRAHMAW